MYKNQIDYNEVIENNGNKEIRRNNLKLILDCIYCSKKPYRNTADMILPKLMEVKNQGGFRYLGNVKNNLDIKYVVLYTTNEDLYWNDELDEELGLFIYYGDNKIAGNALHETKLNGNLILKNIFDLLNSNNFEDRKKIPPIFLFEKANTSDVKFSGLLVPGYKGITQKEWLTALWAKREEGGRFQNYKAMFTVLNTTDGSKYNPKDSSINLNWLKDVKEGKAFDSEYSPIAWKNFIKYGIYKPLSIKRDSGIRTRDNQLPETDEGKKMLDVIHKFFKDLDNHFYSFENFAIDIAKLADRNIINCEHTRPTRDGGRDAIGEYRIMNNLENLAVSLKTTFALEAKCYNYKNNEVGVKETSRLISRIKNREFGIMVTTSYVGKQAYEEIIEDQHPISIIAGKDIIDILYRTEDIKNVKQLQKYLENKYKNI